MPARTPRPTPTSKKATNTIDGFGDVQSVIDPLKHKTSYTYDADRNEVTTTDALGHTTTNVYDLANEQTEVKRPGGSVLTTGYNLDGTVLDQKNGAGHAIETYTYDPLARVTSMTDADGNTTSYTYDPAGNRLTVQQPGGDCTATTPTGCTTYTYDADNEVTSITYSDGTTPNVTNITYDNDGQRTDMTDGSGTWTYTYDALNRLSTVTEGTNGTVSYGYDLRGDVTNITYPDGNAVTNTYDGAGDWTSTKDWLGNTDTFTYDADSNLVYIKDGTTGDLDHLAFNEADQLFSISDTDGTTKVFSASYGRDADGLVTSDSSQPSTTKSYAYTALNQLCYAGSSATSPCGTPPSGSQAYAYSTSDNLVSDNGTRQSFDAADRLCWSETGSSPNACATLPSGATTYGYDPSGNLTSITPPSTSSTALTYDQADQLTTYAQGLIKATYTYNADGLRMSKAITGGATSDFAWDLSGALPLLLSDGTSDYIYGPGGLPLELVTGSTVLWYHHDQLGSTRALTNSAGASVATYTYDPYGNLTTCTGATVTVAGSNLCTASTGIVNPFTYAGQYRDDESGYYYLRARYYDSATGQFLSVDPLVAQTESPYGYVGDSPLNGVDATGRDVGFSVCFVTCLSLDSDPGFGLGVGTPGGEVSVGTISSGGGFSLIDNFENNAVCLSAGIQSSYQSCSNSNSSTQLVPFQCVQASDHPASCTSGDWTAQETCTGNDLAKDLGLIRAHLVSACSTQQDALRSELLSYQAEYQEIERQLSTGPAPPGRVPPDDG